jgi:hypothetical protein
MDFTTAFVNKITSFYDDEEVVESANVILIDSKIREIMRDNSSADDSVFVTLPAELMKMLGNISTTTTSTAESNENIHRDPMSIVVPITVLYVVIFIVGILGNMITCAVITTNRTMHTATNYYLFNLAVSDSLILLFGESDFKHEVVSTAKFIKKFKC